MHGPAPTAAAPRMREGEFVAMMALLQALQALAIDIMLPALGVIAHDLGTTDPNQRQLVVGVFLISSGFGSLFSGSVADRFGRRPVLFTCLAAYMVFSLSAALVTSFTALLVVRAFAGFFASGMVVMSGTIIRDRFEGDKMASTQSLVSMVFMVVPMAAPSAGQAILLVAGWRWIFGVMATMAAVMLAWSFFRLPETLHPEFRQRIDVAAIARNMKTALLNRAAFGYVFGMALIQGALFGYINSAEQLVAEHFGAGTRFPLFFGGMALAMAAANLTNSRIVQRFGARRVSHSAVIAYIVVSALQLYFAVSGHETLWVFAVLMTLNLCLMAFVSSNFQSVALQPFARIAGAAASVQAFIRLVLAAVLGALIGQAFDGTARPLATALLVAGCSALLLVLYSEHGRLFRRLHGAVAQA